MSTIYVPDPEALRDALETLQPGDCVLADSFQSVAGSSKELLALVEKLRERQVDFRSSREGVDTTGAKGSFFFHVCQEMAALDRQQVLAHRREGIARAREEGKYKGRRPIAVDETLFDEVAARWHAGEITAREAMSRLDLKPNTFYRRIKEREESKMKDYKKMEKEFREEIKDSARQSKKAMDELKKQVRDEAKELKKTADERLDAHDVEKEIRREKRRAEAERSEELRQLRRDVEEEARAYKEKTEA